jgi:hypothetical protein
MHRSRPQDEEFVQYVQHVTTMQAIPLFRACGSCSCPMTMRSVRTVRTVRTKVVYCIAAGEITGREVRMDETYDMGDIWNILQAGAGVETYRKAPNSSSQKPFLTRKKGQRDYSVYASAQIGVPPPPLQAAPPLIHYSSYNFIINPLVRLKPLVKHIYTSTFSPL